MRFWQQVGALTLVYLLVTADFALNYVLLRFAFAAFGPSVSFVTTLAGVWTVVLILTVGFRVVRGHTHAR